MVTGKIYLGDDTAPGVAIYESNETGTPLKRNNVYLNTITDINGNWNLDLPASNNFFITVQYLGAKKTFTSSSIPNNINLNTIYAGTGLNEVEVSAKRTYWWLLLLIIPGYYIYKQSKKRK